MDCTNISIFVHAFYGCAPEYVCAGDGGEDCVLCCADGIGSRIAVDDMALDENR